MSPLTGGDKTALLRLARSVMENALMKGVQIRRPDSLSPVLTENRGCFVTLHKRERLRGCIGTIEPIKPLVEAVEENAFNSAFKDPRFPPLSRGELEIVEIEVSVLTAPEDLAFRNAQELSRQLKTGVHGVILTRGWHKATFLPQVWEQLPEVEKFLSHLCMKAGMGKDCWKKKDVRVQTYEAEYFSEHQ